MTAPERLCFALRLLTALLWCGFTPAPAAASLHASEYARDRDEDDDDRYRDDYEEDEEDGDGDDDDDDDRRGRDAIPRDARLVTEGKGSLEYKAPRDGRIYLYDPDLDKVIYSGALYRDEVFAVQPDRNRVQIDGKTVKDKIMKKKHAHRVYFLRHRWHGREER